jgi:hypothetical protein
LDLLKRKLDGGQGDSEVLIAMYDEMNKKQNNSFFHKSAVKRVKLEFKNLLNALNEVSTVRSGVCSPVERSERIAKALCSGFFLNVCICNSIQVEAGYTPLANQKESFVLHPSSVLKINNTVKATWIIYQKALVTSNNYILIATRINPQWIKEHAPNWFKILNLREPYPPSLSYGEIDLNLGDLRKKLFINQCEVLQQMRKKWPSAVIHIPKCDNNSLPVIMYSPSSVTQKAKQFIDKWKTDKMNETTTLLKLHNLRYTVTVGPGCSIILAAQHTWRKLKYEFYGNKMRTEISDILKSYGEIIHLTYFNNQSTTCSGAVTFMNKEDALKAQSELRKDGKWALKQLTTAVEDLHLKITCFPRLDQRGKLGWTEDLQGMEKYYNVKVEYRSWKHAIILCQNAQHATDLLFRMPRSKRPNTLSLYFKEFKQIKEPDILRQLESQVTSRITTVAKYKLKLENSIYEDLVKDGIFLENLLEPFVEKIPSTLFRQIQSLVKQWENKFSVSLKLDYKSLYIIGILQDKTNFQRYLQNWLSENWIYTFELPLPKKTILQLNQGEIILPVTCKIVEQTSNVKLSSRSLDTLNQAVKLISQKLTVCILHFTKIIFDRQITFVVVTALLSSLKSLEFA